MEREWREKLEEERKLWERGRGRCEGGERNRDREWVRKRGRERERGERWVPGVNFTNILCAAFTLIDPQSANNDSQVISHFELLGSVYVKAAQKMLMILTLESISSTFYSRIFCIKVFSLVRVWLWTNIRTKNAHVRRWWYRTLVGGLSNAETPIFLRRSYSSSS